MAPIKTLAIFTLGVSLPLFADFSGTGTLSPGGEFGFGSNPFQLSLSSNGASLTFVGGAKGAVFASGAGLTTYNNLTATTLEGLVSSFSTSPIPVSSLTAGTTNGTIIGMALGGGEYAKMLVTSIGSTGLGFQFFVFQTAPTITAVWNNANQGLSPSPGIEPSSIIVGVGTNLAAPGSQIILQDTTMGLPSMLNGSTAFIAAGTQTYPLAYYYASPTQVALEVPAGVPSGKATLTIAANGGTASFPVNVVPYGYAIDTYGDRLAVLQDSVDGHVFTFGQPGMPNEYTTTWGGGAGSDPLDSNTFYISSPNTINTPVWYYVDGIQATQLHYFGGSVYPGVQVGVWNIPPQITGDCFHVHYVVTGAPGSQVVSNPGILPVTSDGSPCTSQTTGLNAAMLTNLAATFNLAIVGVGTTSSTNATGQTNTQELFYTQALQSNSDLADTLLYASRVAVAAGPLSPILIAPGACWLAQGPAFTATFPGITPLNLGSVTATYPTANGPTATATLASSSQAFGILASQLPAGSVGPGGTVTVTATGGTGSGAGSGFKLAEPFSLPENFTPTFPSDKTVHINQGLTLNWTGGAPGSLVHIRLSSPVSPSLTSTITCAGKVEDGTLTLPSWLAQALSPGTGTLTVQNSTVPTLTTVNGYDITLTFGFNTTTLPFTFSAN